jgi:glutaredoxin 3
MPKTQKNVKIYTSVTCPWCIKTKEFLKANNVTYDEISVTNDEKARTEVFKKSGQMGVPVIDVEGTIIVGYDRTSLKKALELN